MYWSTSNHNCNLYKLYIKLRTNLQSKKGDRHTQRIEFTNMMARGPKLFSLFCSSHISYISHFLSWLYLYGAFLMTAQSTQVSIYTHWWQRLPCKAPPAHQERWPFIHALTHRWKSPQEHNVLHLGSVSCPRILWRADCRDQALEHRPSDWWMAALPL